MPVTSRRPAQLFGPPLGQPRVVRRLQCLSANFRHLCCLFHRYTQRASMAQGRAPRALPAPAAQVPTGAQLSCQHHDVNNPALPTVIIIMGVAGCGKSTVGALLAHILGCPFYEGDAYHPPENVAKMQAGIPLVDEDRWPWLARLAGIVQHHLASRQPAVLSCSALKPEYRRLLRTGQRDGGCSSSSATGPRGIQTSQQQEAAVDGLSQDAATNVAFVLLDPPRAVLEARLSQRAAEGSHFMPPSLLASQLGALQYREEELYLHFSGSTAVQPAQDIVQATLQHMQQHGCGRAGRF